MSEIESKWDLIKETVRREYDITDVAFNTWIVPLKFYSVQDNTVIISIPSDQSTHLNYIKKKYSDSFHVTISEIMNHEYDVSFELENNLQKKDSLPYKNVSYNINYENTNLNPKYKFDTFVVGNYNKMAHAASLAVAESPGEAYNPLYIYGGAGLGKTHLMHAIGHFILEHNENMKVLYVTSEDFTNEVIKSVRSGNASDINKLREKYRTVDVLMVDDVQFIIGKESTQEEFFNTFNALHSLGKQIVLSSDKPPKQLATLDERLISRFGMGIITDIKVPDYETKMAILMKNAESCDIYISKEIIEYIANNINSNIRELEGAFNKIVAYSKLNNVEMDLPKAEEALRDVISPDKPLKINAKYITDIVTEHYGIKPDSIFSKKRSSEIALSRQIIMYLCKEMTDLNLSEIGSFLGRDHTTVMYGIDKITADIKKDNELASNIEVIKNKISPS
jgi:chromosomal replication initiator protein DnaA